MRYGTYGKDGPEVSALGFGVMRLPRRKSDGAVNFRRAVSVMRRALDAGVNFFDSHHNYHHGQSEEAIGRALDSSGSTLAVDYEFRLNPAVAQIRRLIDEGILGKVEAFTLYHFRRPFKRDKWQGWIQRREEQSAMTVSTII